MTASNQQAAFPTFTYEEEESPALNDISTILLGAQAFTGKALHGAGQAVRAPDETTDAKARAENAQRREAERTMAVIQAQITANLSDWDNQEIDVGGVRMTRRQEHEALGKVIEHGDKSAEWAVKHGYIREDEKEAYIARAKQRYKLEDEIRLLHAKERAGVLDDAGKMRLNNATDELHDPAFSHIDNGITAATAEEHQQAWASYDDKADRNGPDHEMPDSQTHNPEQESGKDAEQRSTRSVASTLDDSPNQPLDSLKSLFSSAATPNTELDPTSIGISVVQPKQQIPYTNG